MFDSDNSGLIDTTELRAALASLGVRTSKAEVKALLARYDTDGGGDICFEEFCELIKQFDQEDEVSEEQVQARLAFDFFDEDKSGAVNC